MAQDNEIVVVYDGECLFCRNYCRLVRLRKAAGLLKLVDARENSPITANTKQMSVHLLTLQLIEKGTVSQLLF